MAGVIVRVIGMFYRIPVTRIIGDRGNGYYAIAYQIYTIMLLISSYSLPLAVSKMVSARVAKGQFKNAQKIYRASMAFAFVVGGGVSLVVFFGADLLAGLMLEPMSAIALRIFAPTLVVVAVIGVMRGYFQGMGTMMPTAVSQIIEQIINAAISIAAAYFLFGYGTKVAALLRDENYAYAYGAAGSTLGTCAGALSALLFLLFVMAVYQRVFKRQAARDKTRRVETYAEIFGVLMLTILPVIMSTAIYNISDLIDQRLFLGIMIDKGFGNAKTELWGVFSGKYKVLTNVPVAVASAMCASAIPTLTGLMADGDMRGLRKRVSMVMRVTMLITIPCAVGLGVLASPIMHLLYGKEQDLAVRLMQVGSTSVIFYSMSTLSNGVLQGINRMKIPVRNACIALVIHLAALYGMLEYLDLNIYAVVYANMIFAFCMCLFNSLSIRKYLKYKQEFKRTFVIPLLASAVMGLIVYLIYMLLSKLAGDMVTVPVAVALGAAVYFVVLLFLKGVGEEELSQMPGGRSLVKLAKLLRLL